MRFSVNIPNFGDFADVRTVAEVAAAAEQAGWDRRSASDGRRQCHHATAATTAESRPQKERRCELP